MESCQESVVILTGLKVSSEKLSRTRRYFDRLEGVAGKAVKNRDRFAVVGEGTLFRANKKTASLPIQAVKRFFLLVSNHVIKCSECCGCT